MKTIGLIGGMSWESTVPYYRRINEVARDRLGGLHSAKIVLISVDFHEIEALQRSGEQLADAARTLEAAGADFLVLCTNTMHKVAPQIESGVRIPLLHIADATAARIAHLGIQKVGLLGTAFTMEEEFYRGRLESVHGIEVVVPEPAERDLVHRVIYEELCLGETRDDSRARYRSIMSELVSRGARGIILGCTEIGMLVSAEDASVPLFDTAEIHAVAAAELALAGRDERA